MPLAAKLDSRTSRTAGPAPDRGARILGTRRLVDVIRDLALLVTTCLTVGLAAGFGMMLAVLVLA